MRFKNRDGVEIRVRRDSDMPHEAIASISGMSREAIASVADARRRFNAHYERKQRLELYAKAHAAARDHAIASATMEELRNNMPVDDSIESWVYDYDDHDTISPDTISPEFTAALDRSISLQKNAARMTAGAKRILFKLERRSGVFDAMITRLRRTCDFLDGIEALKKSGGRA